MSKIILSVLVCLLVVNGYAQEKGFVIKCRIPGMQDGVSVALLTAEDLSSEVIAETVVENGQFELKGRVESPVVCTLVTNNLGILTEADQEKGEKIKWTYTPVFVDNVSMMVEASHYDSIPFSSPITSGFRITGGEIQKDFNEYNWGVYKSGKENPWDFIQTHPYSAVSAYLGNKMMRQGYNLTKEDVEKLEKAVVSVPADPVRFAAFKQNCEYAKMTAKNSSIVNLELNDMKGNACNLSEVIPLGKYVLVDFWATWCGPCMAAIPRVKELAERFPDNFTVVGISCDTDLEAWKTAIEREQAGWPQYVLTGKGYKDFLTKYQTYGVPYFLLVDKEGKVLCNPDTEELGREVERLCK